MRRNIDIGLLRAFVQVAEHGSMTVASKSLHLTQGAVSQQIKRLEELLDCILFERAPRRIHLTPAGERLLQKASALLDLNDEIVSGMSGASRRVQVRLGVPYDLVGPSLAPILKQFAEASPDVDVDIRCESSPQLLHELRNGSLDLALVEQPAGNATGERLCTEPLAWVGMRGGQAHLKRPLALTLVAESCAFKPAVLKALRSSGLEWQTVYENGNLDATIASVRAGLAVSAWLPSTVPGDLMILGAESDLPALPRFAVTLHMPRGGGTPEAAQLANCIRAGLRAA